jgi:hypothetical protein
LALNTIEKDAGDGLFSPGHAALFYRINGAGKCRRKDFVSLPTTRLEPTTAAKCCRCSGDGVLQNLEG